MSTVVRTGREGPARPALFRAFYLGLPLVSAAAVAAILVTAPQWPMVEGTVETSTWLAVLLAGGLVLVGDILPIFQHLRRSPRQSGTRWSAAFAIALLTFAGLVPAVAVTLVAIVVACALRRMEPARAMVNIGVTVAGVLVAWAVLTAFGWHATLTEPWAPASVGDVLMVLLAVAAMLVVNDVVVIAALSAVNGTPFVPQVRTVLQMHGAAATAHQLAVTPVIVAVMAYAPVMTVLMVLPVTAVHRALVAQQESTHAATHDDLTQLPNRGRFVKLADRALVGSARSGYPAAVLIVDLNGFKQINDVLGHPVGDQVLVEVAERLRHGVRTGDLVARMGGDEFGVLLPRVDSADDCMVVAERLYREMAAPCEVEGHVVDLGASIGAALAPHHGADFDTLYSRADLAMFLAKRDRTGPQLYDPLLAGGGGQLGPAGHVPRPTERTAAS